MMVKPVGAGKAFAHSPIRRGMPEIKFALRIEIHFHTGVVFILDVIVLLVPVGIARRGFLRSLWRMDSGYFQSAAGECQKGEQNECCDA